MAVLSYGLASFVRLTVLAITSKDGMFGAPPVSAARGPRKELARLGRAAKQEATQACGLSAP